MGSEKSKRGLKIFKKISRMDRVGLSNVKTQDTRNNLSGLRELKKKNPNIVKN